MMLAAPLLSPRAGDAAPDALAQLCADFWGDYLRSHPTFATSTGEHAYDAQLEDVSPEARERHTRRLRDFLRRARALDPVTLGDRGQLDRGALIEELEGELALLRCDFDAWVVDAINGPQTEFSNLPAITRITTPEDASRFVARCRAMPHFFDDHMGNLKR